MGPDWRLPYSFIVDDRLIRMWKNTREQVSQEVAVEGTQIPALTRCLKGLNFILRKVALKLTIVLKVMVLSTDTSQAPLHVRKPVTKSK